MSVAEQIRETIAGIPIGRLFATRQFLPLGSRGAVDQQLYLLVKSGAILRVSWGLFLRAGSTVPSAVAVAGAKAAAFGKQIFEHGADAAYAFGFPVRANQTPTFNCTGRSSSFRYPGGIIRLVGMSPRKLQGSDSPAGKLIRAMWYLGKSRCSRELISRSYRHWNSSAGELRRAAPVMAGWMLKLFPWERADPASIIRGGAYRS